MNLQEIIKELKENIKEKLPGENFKVILYGSYARGKYDENSDIDILIILDSYPDTQKKDKIYEVCSSLNIKYEIWIDVSLISKKEMDTIKGRQPFIQNALREGITI